MSYFSIIAIISGFVSALCWLRASVVKITPEKGVERRLAKAKKKGETPSFAVTSLDGWDMSETFRTQSFWNSIAAVFAAISISVQTLSQVLQNA